MPRSSAWFVRLSLVYLALGFSFGAVLLANKGMAYASPAALGGARGLDRFIPAHAEILLLGWLVQLALGVAYWILPRYTSGMPRGNPAQAWFSLFSLNAGILLAVVGETANVPAFVLAGRILEATSMVALLAVAWGRVRKTAR